MKKMILFVPFLLLGCASVTQVKAPNGEPAYEIKCGNAVKAKCQEKATEVCPQGYRELERKADPYGDSTKVGNLGLLELRADTTTFMLIQCK